MKRLKKKPKQARSRSIVDAILTATRQLIESPNRGGVSMRGIAKRAGVGVGSIYDYFEDRESIFASVVERLTHESFEELFHSWQSWDDMPLEDAILKLLDAVSARYLKSPPLLRMAFRTLVGIGGVPTVLVEQARFAEQMSARFERELPDVPVGIVRASLRDVTDTVMAMLVVLIHREDASSAAATKDMLRRFILMEFSHLRALQRAAQT